MAKGDVQDFVKRLKAVLPPWFGEAYPLLNALLAGYATMDAFIYSLTEYLNAQMRIQTATGQNLDLIACDFYEGILERPENMSDEQFRKFILASLLQEQATRKGMEKAIELITGYTPIIWEGFQFEDGFFLDSESYYDDSFFGGLIPYNFWIEVFVNDPTIQDFLYFDGDDSWLDGDIGDQSFLSGDDNYIITYDEILAVVNRVKVGGTVPHLTVTYV